MNREPGQSTPFYLQLGDVVDMKGTKFKVTRLKGHKLELTIEKGFRIVKGKPVEKRTT